MPLTFPTVARWRGISISWELVINSVVPLNRALEVDEMMVDGRCLCGFLTFEAEVDERSVTICNCTDCQIHSGSAFRVTVPAVGETFKFLSGEPKTYVKTSERGHKRALAFCPKCGTPIYSMPGDGKAGFFGLRVGPLRQRNLMVPSGQIWCRSAQSWTNKMSAMPKSETE